MSVPGWREGGSGYRWLIQDGEWRRNGWRKYASALARGEEKATGVGVGNIYRRVHGMYRDGEVFIYSSEGRGTVVQMAFTP